MKIAVIGASNMIGEMILQLLAERNFPLTQLIPVCAENDPAKTVLFKGQGVKTVTIEAAYKLNPHFALFSGDPGISLKWAEKFAKQSCYVIDNSPIWRMDENVKLVIPEINASQITKKDYIIASPNCTSIQMAMALAPLHKIFKIKRVVVSTYQAVSGAGQEAVNQLEGEQKHGLSKKILPHDIYNNCIPHIDEFNVNGYTQDELRLMGEIKKILNDPSTHITATCARIPIVLGHSESVNIEFENDFVLNKVKQLLNKAEGVEIMDTPSENKYPMPFLVKDKDEVFVGRIRRDYSIPNSLNMWITANNLRRGAATNALKIAEHILKNFIT